MSEADTVRTNIVRETAQFLARMVFQHVFPLSYDRLHYVDQMRFRVRVEAYPHDRRSAELRKTVDEDDSIAD